MAPTCEHGSLIQMLSVRDPESFSAQHAREEGPCCVENEGQKMLDNILKAGQTPKAALKQMAENVDRHFAEMKE